MLFRSALFYLRGIADTLYKNGALPAKVLSKDIYLGAIPWVLLQLVLVVIVIFVPQTVTMFIPKAEKIDTDTIQIEVPDSDLGSGTGDMKSEAPAAEPGATPEGETKSENPFEQSPPPPEAGKK